MRPNSHDFDQNALEMTAFDRFEPRFSRGFRIFDPPLPPPLLQEMAFRPGKPVVFDILMGTR